MNFKEIYLASDIKSLEEKINIKNYQDLKELCNAGNGFLQTAMKIAYEIGFTFQDEDGNQKTIEDLSDRDLTGLTMFILVLMGLEAKIDNKPVVGTRWTT